MTDTTTAPELATSSQQAHRNHKAPAQKPQAYKPRRREREMIAAGDRLAKGITDVLETLNLITITAPGRSPENMAYALRQMTAAVALGLKVYVEDRDEFRAADRDDILDDEMFVATKKEAERYRSEGFDGPLTVTALRDAVDKAHEGLGIERAAQDGTAWRLIDQG